MFTFLIFFILSSFVSKLSNLAIATNYKIYNVCPIFGVADKRSTLVQKVFVKQRHHMTRPPSCQLVSSKWLPPSAISTHFLPVLATTSSKKEKLSFPEGMRVIVVSFSVLFDDKSAPFWFMAKSVMVVKVGAGIIGTTCAVRLKARWPALQVLTDLRHIIHSTGLCNTRSFNLI